MTKTQTQEVVVKNIGRNDIIIYLLAPVDQELFMKNYACILFKGCEIIYKYRNN